MEIIITNHALRQIKKLPRQTALLIMEGMEVLKGWPEVSEVKKLKNRPDYRLRIGRYRVVFEVSGNTLHITQVLLRNENTY